MSVRLSAPDHERTRPARPAHPSYLRFAALLVTLTIVAGAVAVAVGAHPPAVGVEAEDTAGRIGFVATLVAVLCVVWWLDARARQPVVPDAEIFVPPTFVVGLFTAFAATWFLYGQLVLDAFSRGKFGYLEWLTQVTTLTSTSGIWNVWTPYPQGTQELIVGLRMLSTSIASVASSDIWTDYTLFRLLFGLVFLVVPSIVVVWLVGVIGRAFGRATQSVALVTMALSFAVVYFGAGSAFVADPLPVALTIAALLALLRRRFVLAGLAIGLGAGLKLFPILLLPALVVLLGRGAAIRVIGACVVVLVVVFGPGLLANAEIFASPLNWQSSRPPWESWYAFANWVGGAPHEHPQAYFRDASVGNNYGWVFTGITPVVSTLQTPVPAGPLRWENIISFSGSVIALALCLCARSRTPRSLIRWSLFALASFFALGIGWSPQYELFLIPLVVLAFDDPRVGAGAAVLLQAVTFVDYPLLLPWAYFYGGSAVWLDWGAVLARYVVLAWLCIVVLRSEAAVSALRVRVRRLMRLSLLGAVTCAPLLMGAAPPSQQDTPGCVEARTPIAAEAQRMFSESDWLIPNGWFFTQAGESADRGYSIADDSAAQMWSEFLRLGGARTLGFPASRRFVWHGVLSQATQRAVLQWSPVVGQVEFANLLDLMHDEGRDDDLLRLKQIPPPLDVDEAGLAYEAIAARRLAWLDARPAIKSSYCNAPGNADPVQLWGLPTSQIVNMSESGGEVYVLRAQRAAFQEWVAGAPWAAPGEVTVVLAGDLAKEFELLPPEALVPEPAPPR